MSNEQMRELISALTQGRVNTFAQCTARYNGSRQHEKVDEFILQASIFKTTQQINDATALVGFPLLLEGEAATWWQGVHAQILTWDAASNALRQQFAPPKPAYQIYLDIFGDKQSSTESTDKFVSRKRALLARINPQPAENIQLDMLYGLLSLNIRAAVARLSINTFAELIERARQAEELQIGSSARNQQSNTQTCNYCNRRGHTSEVCRTKKSEEAKKKPQASTSDVKPTVVGETAVKCYGCGAPGVYRANCPTCRQDRKPIPKDTQFYAVHLQLGADIPTVNVDIRGCQGVAHVDTGARTSIASEILHKHLLDIGCKFSEVEASITVADGVTRKNEMLLTTKTVITMGGRSNWIQFTVLPYAHNNRTLLGIDFLEQAGIVLNLPQRTWYYIDQPQNQFPCNLKPKHEMMNNTLPAASTSEFRAVQIATKS